MKVLVTGANGLLGSNLVRELLQRNYQVRALILEGSTDKTLKNLPIEIFEGNILDYQALLLACKDIDFVVHCAANTSMFPARSEIVNEVNIKGTKNMVEVCQSCSVKRLIYVGTANSFISGNEENPGIETNPYGAYKYGLDYMDSKYEAQQLVLEAANDGLIDAVVVNPTFMIGPYDGAPSSGEMILRVYRNQIPGYTFGGKNWVAVKDVAVAIANAFSKAKSGECYILGNENLTYKQAFDRIAETIGAKSPKIRISTILVRVFGRFNSMIGRLFHYNPGLTKELAILGTEVHYYSPEKARKDLKMPQTPIEEAVKDCFNWFNENGYLTKQ